MEFAIGVENKEVDLETILSCRCKYFLPHDLKYSIESNGTKPVRLYKLIIDDPEQAYLERHIRSMTAEILSEILINDVLERQFAKEQLKKYPKLDAVEGAKLFCLAWKGIKQDPFWENDLRVTVENHMQSNDEIVFEGILRFRMKQLCNKWNELLEKAFAKLMIEKEYKEFISLLKFFVDLQPPKLDEIHVIINKEGKYILRDKFKAEINSRRIIFGMEQDAANLNQEDLLISALISIAPLKIIVHGISRANNRRIFETIGKVFGERVEYLN